MNGKNEVQNSKKPKKSRKIKGWYVFGIIGLLLGSLYIGFFVPLREYDMTAGEPPSGGSGTYAYDIPLDTESPWPKFRANARSTGRSAVIPEINNTAIPWSFQTGKGIFSSPVIDQEGTVYIGSADHYFYAIYRNGSLKWKFETNEIIDSSALLDDQGRVIFGSGDAHVYCLNRDSGAIIWTFQAHTEEEAEEEFGLELHNVNWFEGNVAMLADGTILAPNDNQILYALDPDTGEPVDHYLGNEMIWSLPAVNVETNRIFFGTTNFALKTMFSYNTETGKKEWTTGGLGSVAASPLLTSNKANGGVIAGGYDGIVRAMTQRNGKQLWKTGLGAHIYASPGQLSDGTIVQPSADGSVYALNPSNGKILWKFDTLEPIRSSPAIDGEDTIYVGSGEGKLFAINPDGTLRWAYQLIHDERNDLNGSPGLGKEGVYIAGESGQIFFVPYDYPLSSNGQADPNAFAGPDELLPDEGVFLYYTTAFGGLRQTPPTSIDANQPLAFSLYVREDGDTVISQIDRKSIEVSVTGNPNYTMKVSANNRFILLTPKETWTSSLGGPIDIEISGKYKINLRRIGLKFFGGRSGGRLDSNFTFTVKPRIQTSMPFMAPNTHLGNTTVFELSRFAAPNPAMLPSYNQIGFDSLHYLGGIVEANAESALVWFIGGKLDGNETVIDPSLRERFPLRVDFDNGLVTFHNYDGFAINFIGSWDMPFAWYRISTTYNTTTQKFNETGALAAVANCDEIDFYGTGLKLMGMSEFKSGQMTAFGGCNVETWYEGKNQIPGGIGTPSIIGDQDKVTLMLEGSTLQADNHVYSLLLVDENGNALPLYYSHNTHLNQDTSGILTGVELDFGKKDTVEGDITVHFMIDSFSAYSETISF